MTLLVVSRKGLSELIWNKIAKHIDIEKAIDFYDIHKEGYKESKEVIDEAKRVKASSAIVISNFKLACELLANGCKTVFVLMPKVVDSAEIIKADIYKLEGEIKLEKL